MTRVQGLEKLRAQIRAIPLAQRQAASAALRKSGEEIAASVRRNAPRRSGDLARSVELRSGLGGRDEALVARGGGDSIVAKAEAGLRFRVVASAFYAAFVEFGTNPKSKSGWTLRRGAAGTRRARVRVGGIKAQPFFWPTVRAWKKRAIARVSAASRRAVKQALGK